MNSAKTLVIVGIILVVIVSVTLFVRGGREQPDTANDSSGLIVGANAIYVAEQAASETVSVAVVHLEKPGFVVIYEDVAGELGEILGASRVVPKGETKNLPPIALSRATKDGEIIYAMLHLDDGDSVFNVKEDRPARDKGSEEPIMMIVTVSAEAEEPADTSL